MPKRGFKELLAEANAVVETISVEELAGQLGDPGLVVVDVREHDEIEQGVIPGALHIPRGVLELQADPESPAYNPALKPDGRVVLYCGSGGRSALAAKTLCDMEYANVYSLVGGFGAWRNQNDGP